MSHPHAGDEGNKVLPHWEYARHVVEPEGLLLVHVMLLLEVVLLQQDAASFRGPQSRQQFCTESISRQHSLNQPRFG